MMFINLHQMPSWQRGSPHLPVLALEGRSWPEAAAGVGRAVLPLSLPPTPFREALPRSRFGKRQLRRWLPSAESCSPVPSCRLRAGPGGTWAEHWDTAPSCCPPPTSQCPWVPAEQKPVCERGSGQSAVLRHPGLKSESEICLFSIL